MAGDPWTGVISTSELAAKSRRVSAAMSFWSAPRFIVSWSALANTSTGAPWGDLLQQHAGRGEVEAQRHAGLGGLEFGGEFLEGIRQAGGGRHGELLGGREQRQGEGQGEEQAFHQGGERCR